MTQYMLVLQYQLTWSTCSCYVSEFTINYRKVIIDPIKMSVWFNWVHQYENKYYAYSVNNILTMEFKSHLDL